MLFLPAIETVVERLPAEEPLVVMLACFAPTQLWKIAIEENLRHFAQSSPRTQTHFYSQNSLASAIFYARK